ncbi:MAG: radical SAM protein [Bacteroidales bacterium]|nr:radical SAM protein [Bacteroidales bacterium]
MKHKNQKEYAGFYEEMKWIQPREAAACEAERRALLNRLSKVVSWGFHDSKADVSDLSEGCRLCGEGEWSCLFINGVCNARCFYCPAKQDERGEPVTSSVTFGNPEDYVAYLKKFNYKGASISGGEPFLTFERTIGFIRKIRAEVGKDIYIWMYTNGILATREKFVALRDAGLNEVRFDISATGYSWSTEAGGGDHRKYYGGNTCYP